MYTELFVGVFGIKYCALYSNKYDNWKVEPAYCIGETLIKPAVLTMVKAVCIEEASKKLITIPFACSAKNC